MQKHSDEMLNLDLPKSSRRCFGIMLKDRHPDLNNISRNSLKSNVKKEWEPWLEFVSGCDIAYN